MVRINRINKVTKLCPQNRLQFKNYDQQLKLLIVKDTIKIIFLNSLQLLTFNDTLCLICKVCFQGVMRINKTHYQFATYLLEMKL